MKKILLFILLFLPLITFGEGTEYTLLEPIPCIQGTGQTCTEGGLIKKIETNYYIQYIYKLSFAFAAVAAVVVIMYAGFEYATTDIIGTKAAAKSRIENAVVGLLTLLASYLILQTIDPRLTDIDTKLEPIDIKGQVFDYDALVNTATDYQVRHDLDEASAKAKALRGEANILREQRDALDDSAPNFENKFQELGQKALALDRQAKLLTSNAAADARYKLQIERFDQYDLYKLDDEAFKATYTEGINQINGGIDESISQLKSLGAIEEIQDLEKNKSFYVESYKQDVLTDKYLARYKEFSGSLPRQQDVRVLAIYMEKGFTLKDVNADPLKKESYVPTPMTSDPVLKERFEKERVARIEKIRSIVPPLPEELNPPKP